MTTFDQVKEQPTRTAHEFPTLEILNKRENINDYVVDDFKISKQLSTSSTNKRGDAGVVDSRG